MTPQVVNLKEYNQATQKQLEQLTPFEIDRAVSNNVQGNKEPINKTQLYRHASLYAVEAINRLVLLMRTSRRETVQMFAASKILDKALPDLKATELSGDMRNQLVINLVTYGKNDPLAKQSEVIESGTDSAISTVSEANVEAVKDTTA